MISITSASDQMSEFQCPIVDLENEHDLRLEQNPLDVSETISESIEFDLFAEARQIYARARSAHRVRSSSII